MNATQQELNCLKKLMEDKNPELLIRLTAAHFGNAELGKIYLLIKRHYLEYSAFCGWDTLRAVISKACKTPDKLKMMSSLLDQIQARDVSGLTDDALVTELLNVSKCRLVLDRLEEITRKAEDKDEEGVIALFNTTYQELNSESPDELKNADMSSLATQDLKHTFKTTGIQGIDRYGGITQGSFVVLAGGTGAGKSTAAHSIGIHQYLNYEGSVGYWSWEQGYREIIARIYANQSEVDLGNIIADSLTQEELIKLRVAKANFFCKPSTEYVDFVHKHLTLPDEEFFKELYGTYAKRDNKFFVFDHAPDFDSLMVQMELLRSTQNVKLFIIDYMTLIKAGMAHRTFQSWEMYLKMSEDFKKYVRKHDNIFITPLQYDMGKKGTDPKIKFSKDIENSADLSIAIFQNEDDKQLNTVTCEYRKYRNYSTKPGEQLQNFKMLRDFSKARFLELDF